MADAVTQMSVNCWPLRIKAFSSFLFGLRLSVKCSPRLLIVSISTPWSPGGFPIIKKSRSDWVENLSNLKWSVSLEFAQLNDCEHLNLDQSVIRSSKYFAYVSHWNARHGYERTYFEGFLIISIIDLNRIQTDITDPILLLLLYGNPVSKIVRFKFFCKRHSCSK